MHRSVLSTVFGITLGLVAVAALCLSAALLSPSWFRSIFGSNPLVPETPTPLPVGGTAPGPSPIPLPTVAGSSCGGPEQMTIALLGVDDRTDNYDNPARTDAIMLVNVRFSTHSAAVLSIPRDLYVPLPNLEDVGIYQDRINTAFEYGEIWIGKGHGPAEFKDTIALNFGIRVDRYVLVNFGTVVAAVDALGGIDVDVPEAIYDGHFPADDGDGIITFRVEAGPQHMDGQTALRYARTRHQDDDFKRIERMQLVLLAVHDKLFSPEVIPQIPSLLATLGGLVRTDLSPREIASLACLGPQIDRPAIDMLAVDGTMVIPWRTPTGGSVAIPDREAMTPVVEKFLGK